MAEIFSKNFWLILGGLLVIECCSALAFFYSSLNLAFLIIIFIATLVLTLKKMEWGIYLALAETVTGGLGYLFFYPLGGFRVSVRLVLFVAVMLAWAIQLIRHRFKNNWGDKFILSLLPFGGSLALAGALACLAQRPLQSIFLDANNYLYFFLLLPALASRLKWERLIQIILAGSWVAAIKTAMVLTFFARHLAVLHDSFYKLIRDTRVGEVTAIHDPLFRIFFQSHFYNLIALFLAAAILLFNSNPRHQKMLLAITVWLNFLALLISQSKTFWLAGILGLILLAGYLIKTKMPAKIIKLLAGCLVCLVTAHLAMNLLIGDFSVNLFYSRLNEGDATAGVSSRSAQIMPALSKIVQAPFFGQGFNATITYRSSDPRIKNSSNPEGLYTTDALELGYLDIVLKLGLVGLLGYGWFLLALLFGLYQKSAGDYRLIGFIIGLVILIAVHALTPYLNHPLGISYLVVLAASLKDYS